MPGTDGLPYEFFRVFRQQLAPVLTRVFNVAFKLLGVRRLGLVRCLLSLLSRPWVMSCVPLFLPVS